MLFRQVKLEIQHLFAKPGDWPTVWYQLFIHELDFIKLYKRYNYILLFVVIQQMAEQIGTCSVMNALHFEDATN